MQFKTYLICSLFVYFSCNNNDTYLTVAKTMAVSSSDTNPYTSINEIPLPSGFKRMETKKGSFGDWLLNVKLKKDKTVYLFDGMPKRNQGAQFAVMNISVGNKDLQQCADAVMRLRAEYLFAAGKFHEIHFADNDGTGYQFNEPYTVQNLLHYLQQVFGACGSASLARQLNPVSFKDMQAGDVIIHGGFPGHAVIVMDVATNENGIKIYLLAQSYMPAQDIHVLINPTSKSLSPWYLLTDERQVETPEYTFTKNELKRW